MPRKDELTREYIKEKVTTDETWAVRGLLALYRRQTEDEKVAATTKHDNQAGFNAFDAEILTSFAEQVQQGRNLSYKQKNLLFKKIGKYAGQLLKIAQGD